jgi:hypothetical protein
LTLCGAGSTGDRHPAGRCVIDIGHRCGGAAGNAFSGAVAVGVAGRYRDSLTNFGLCEDVGDGNGTGYGDTTGTPLVTYGAQSVCIG